eukprot:scaffold355_cov211-Pinguiococcus_pyrenoidosus.AAC.3
MQLGKKEPKSAALHGCLDRHRARGRLGEAKRLRHQVASKAAQDVEEDDGELEPHAGAEDAFRALGNTGGDEEAGGNGAHHRRQRLDLLRGLGEELVERHANHDRREHDLDGGDGDTHCVDRHHCAKELFTEQRGADDRAQGRGRRHENAQRHVASRNVRAEVGRLASVDRSDKNHAGHQSRVQREALGQPERQQRHEQVAAGKAQQDRVRSLHDAHKIVGAQGDPHGQHEDPEARREVLRREPSKGLRRLQRNAREQNGPDGEQVGQPGRQARVRLHELARLRSNRHGPGETGCLRRGWPSSAAGCPEKPPERRKWARCCGSAATGRREAPSPAAETAAPAPQVAGLSLTKGRPSSRCEAARVAADSLRIFKTTNERTPHRAELRVALLYPLGCATLLILSK